MGQRGVLNMMLAAAAILADSTAASVALFP
jgi:hypothetical protein